MTNPAWDIAVEKGEAAEGTLAGLLGECTIEVKRDSLAHVTGNVFVELHCKGRDSGLNVTTADWWAFAIDDTFGRIARIVLVPTDRLRLLALERRTVYGGDENRSFGALVPLADLAKPL